MAYRSPNWEYTIEFPIPVKFVGVKFPDAPSAIPSRFFLSTFTAHDTDGNPIPSDILAPHYSTSLGRHFHYVDSAAPIAQMPSISLPSHALKRLSITIVPWLPEAQDLAPGLLGDALVSGKSLNPPRVWTLAVEGHSK